MRTITQRSNENGTAVIHMGFMLPVLLVALFAIWQAGVVYDTWQSLKQSASEGARAAGSAPRGQRLAAARRAAEAASGHVTLKRFSLRSSTSKDTSTYTATACSAYAVNIVGIVVKSGVLCRDATARVG
jgi:Flp pilus assembly protein TadG